MKDIFEKWENELEERLPGLRQDVIDEPIPQKKPEIVALKKKKPVFKYMSIACSIAAVIVLCICIIPMLRINMPTEPTDTTSTPQATPPNGDVPSGQLDTSLITVEINPRVIFVTDKEGTIVNVIATNEDADVILSSESFDEDVIGKELSEGLVSYVELATMLGYIDSANTENTVKITSCDDEQSKNALKKAKEKLETHFKEKGIVASVNDAFATVEEICEINEIEKADKISQVVDKFKGKSKLFSERFVEELDESQLEDYYKEMMTDKIKDQLKESIEASEDILKIAEINEQIIAKCFVDYWLVKEYSHLDSEVEKLVSKMEKELESLEKSYGIVIEGTLQLYEYTALLSLDYITGILESLESFENVEEYKKLYELFGKELVDFEKLEKPVTSREEIAEEKKNSIKEQHNNRLDKNSCGAGSPGNQKPDNNGEASPPEQDRVNEPNRTDEAQNPPSQSGHEKEK